MVAFLAIEMFAVKLLLLLWLLFVASVVVVVVVANRLTSSTAEGEQRLLPALAKFTLLFAFVSRSVASSSTGKREN